MWNICPVNVLKNWTSGQSIALLCFTDCQDIALHNVSYKGHSQLLPCPFYTPLKNKFGGFKYLPVPLRVEGGE